MPELNQESVALTAPVALKEPKEIVSHGERRVDDYFWLRDRERPETLDYLNAENAYTRQEMACTEALQRQLYDEMVGRIQETDVSAPVHRARYDYYTRTQAGLQYSIECRRLAGGDEEILLDNNELAKGFEYFQLGEFALSPNQQRLAYSVDTEGHEDFTVRVKDLATQQELADVIPLTADTLEWSGNGETLFYTLKDETLRPFRVMRHRLGTPVEDDVELWREDDERFVASVVKSQDGRFLFLVLDSATTTEVRFLRADAPDQAWQVVVPRKQDVEAEVEHRNGHFLIRINDTGKTFRLVEAAVDAPLEWTEVIAARTEVTLETLLPLRGHLVLMERVNGLRRLRVIPDAGAEHIIEMPEPVYTISLAGNAEFDTAVLRFVYSSLVTPSTAYDYHLDSRDWTMVKRQPVLGGFDPARYVCRRIEAEAQDGVRVPVSIVYRKDTPLDGSAPALLYGYGAYGLTSEPGFQSDRLSLLDRGFVYAIAHIRGGGDLGKLWHEAGRMKNKPNTFTDFIAAAEALIAQKFTSNDRLAILGGSAGGLLMGAVLNLRPDLFGAVIAKVPFVDVLNTMEDATLPLTVGEYEEWGNPGDPEFFHLIRSYSPYDNVTAQAYPALLVTAGLNDPRVSYWEPAKWVAKLRTLKTADAPLLLKVNMGAGHFGVSGRYARFKETAFEYAFLIRQLRPDLLDSAA